LLELKIVFDSWIAEEVGETFAAIDGFYKHTSPLAGSQALDKFNEGCMEESLHPSDPCYHGL